MKIKWFSCLYDFRHLVPLHALLDFLEGHDDAIPDAGLDVAILPPTNATGDITDEDSGGEEDPVIDNVSSNQLNALALAPDYICDQMRGEQMIEEELQTEEADQEMQDVSAVPRRRVTAQRRVRREQREYNWKKELLQDGFAEWPEISSAQNELKSPLYYFELFFNEDVWELLVKYTNQFAAKRNKLGDCSFEEMKNFVAILLLSGYSQVSRRFMYWERSEDSHNNLVSNAMTRDRFQFIMSNFHVCNNDRLDHNDKFAKIRPLLKLLNSKFVEYCPHKEDHSIDESMVPYFGRHGTKQFIRGKPIRYGFKFWCGGPSNGYLTWLEPYQGAGTFQPQYEGLGLGYGVVMNYVDQLPKHPFKIYCDNFFTSFDLLNALSARSIRIVGTIRSNRIDKSCPIISNEEMKKKPRGSFDYRSDNIHKISVVKWNDNNIVSLATNFDRVEPTKSVSRFSHAQKRKINVQQPMVISNYNKHMGGIDRADQNISLYRVSIRGKKWYFPLLAHMIDVAEQNAWQLYKEEGGKLDHLAFRRRIVMNLLESNQKGTVGKGRPSQAEKMDSRFDRLDHFVSEHPFDSSGKRRQQIRCRQCGKKATTFCLKCNVTLHVGCFLPYHTKT